MTEKDPLRPSAQGHRDMPVKRASAMSQLRKVFGHLSGESLNPVSSGFLRFYACISIHDQQIIQAKFAQPLKT